MLFKKDFLLDLLDLYKSPKILENKLVDTTRWAHVYSMVFLHEGKFYQTFYNVGATECQNERPYEYEEDDIECPEVVPVEKTIIVYESVK